jgi:hypothetical protein
MSHLVVLHTYGAQRRSRFRSSGGAEVDLLDRNPGGAPVYRVEYSLRAQLFEEPCVGERTIAREEERIPKGGSPFFQRGNGVSSSS